MTNFHFLRGKQESIIDIDVLHLDDDSDSVRLRPSCLPIVESKHRKAYSEATCIAFLRLTGVSPRYCLQKLLKCCADEKLNSSIMSVKGTKDCDSR